MMNSNMLMIVDVCSVVGSYQQGLVRSAGSVGRMAYEEAVSTHRTPHHLLLRTTEDEDNTNDDDEVVLTPSPINPTTTTTVKSWWNSEQYMALVVDVSGLTTSTTTTVCDSTTITSGGTTPPHLPHTTTSTTTTRTVRCPREHYPLVKAVPVMHLQLPDDNDGGNDETHNHHQRSVEEAGEYVVSIDHCFMINSRALDVAAFTGFTHVTTIGNCFMEGCDAMTDLQLLGMDRHLQTIGTDFLFGCANLLSLQFSNNNNNNESTTANNNNDAGSDNENTANNSGEIMEDKYNRGSFRVLTKIGDRFMCGCTAIEELYLDDLWELREVGGHFMGGCSALEILEMSGARSDNITSVGRYALRGCSSPELLPNIRTNRNCGGTGGEVSTGIYLGELLKFMKLPTTKMNDEEDDDDSDDEENEDEEEDEEEREF